MKYIFTFFLAITINCCLAQSKETGKRLYSILKKHYTKKNKDSVNYYAYKISLLSKEQIHDTLKISSATLFATLEKEEKKSLQFLNQLEVKYLNNLKAKEYKEYLAKVYFSKGSWYFRNSKNKNSLTYFIKTDSLFEAINIKSFYYVMAKVGIIDILMLSGANNKPLDSKQIIPYIEEGYKISDSLKMYVPAGIFLYKKGELFFAENNLEEAEKYFKKSLEISNKINNDVRRSLVYGKLSDIFEKRNMLDSALIYQKKSVKYAKNLTYLEVYIEANLKLGKLYTTLKKHTKAIKYLNKAKYEASKLAFNREETLCDIDFSLAKAHYGKNDIKKGYDYLMKSKLSMEEIQLAKSQDKVNELEAKYQTDKKEQEIAILKSEKDLVEKERVYQRNIMLGGISLISLIGFFLFFLYRNRQKTAKKLQELNKAKSNFFANISHEFRTPLTLISGPIQSELKRQDLSLEERKKFEMIHRNSNRLLSLVDQLLAISKVESGVMMLKVGNYSLQSFIGSIVNSFTYLTEENSQTYLVYNHIQLEKAWFDKDIVEKVVVNLLANALKYTPKNGSIVCNAKNNNDFFYFTVKNSGKGLTREEQTKVFERFYQIDEDSQGIGLGLALLKDLIKLHKGNITVNSVPNSWTTFEVRLPISKKAFSKQEIIIEEEKKVKNQKEQVNEIVFKSEENIDTEKDTNSAILLIVDDNQDIRTYITTLFKNEYTIITGKNGKEGVDLAIKFVPDIIVSDVMMPVKNGIILCNELKADERTSHIPIILLTAKAGEIHELKGIQVGADDYITKPFSEKLLKVKVSNLIEGRKKLQKRYSQEVILHSKDIPITSIDQQFLERVEKILDTKLVEPTFNAQEFSETVGMSRMQLHRKLKALLGVSALELIRSERLKLAAKLLKKSDVNISEVGYSVGFNEHSYFSKVFKKAYGCTPTEYTKQE